MRIPYQLATAAVVLLLAVGGWYYFFMADAQQASGSGTGRADVGSPVDVFKARPGVAIDAIELVGTARAQEAVNIVARTSGRIASIEFQEGQHVKAGTLLVSLDSATEEADLRQAQAQLEDARAQYQRARALSDGRNIAQADVETRRAAVEVAQARVDMARARLREQRIVAPFDGIIGIREVSVGALVDPTTRLTTLDDISNIRLDIMVPERFLSRITIGQPVVATTSAFPEHRFAGRVTQIDSRVDSVTRSVRVQAQIPNEDLLLRPGMFMNVRLVLDQRENAVFVPEEALIVQGSRRYVYVVSDKKAVRTDVVIGTRQDGMVEILDGVGIGDAVVVAGSNRLRGDNAAVHVRRTVNEAEADAATTAAATHHG